MSWSSCNHTYCMQIYYVHWFSFLLVKKVNKYANKYIYFKNVSFITIFIIVFCNVFMKFRHTFSHLKPFAGNFWDMMILHLFLLYFFMYLLFDCAYLCIPLHIAALIPFSIIFCNNSDYISVFFKQVSHTNPKADK